jgi:sulfatase maturation enzyme AslB (radical SAM superfamily)
MIHNGLELSFHKSIPTAQHCCLRSTRFPIDITQNFWRDKNLIDLRQINQKNIWAPGCENCERLESSGLESFRTGMNQNFGIDKYHVSGPSRIDLMFDISCNLACRSCGPRLSTTWQKHLKDNNLWNNTTFSPNNYQDVITALQQLDLSNLKMLVFCGGETLLGQTYWKVTEWLANNVPNAKQQLTVCFQTNGTQPILEKNYDLIDRFHLVKLHVSLDGVGDRFNYLRWPASWSQVVDNIMRIRELAPSNTMFLIEETITIFNLYYRHELATWIKNNFVTNREGDIVNHTQHLAHGWFNLRNCSQPYVDYIRTTDSNNLIPKDWKENSFEIQKMLAQIHKFDQIRGESFAKTFPEVADFY